MTTFRARLTGTHTMGPPRPTVTEAQTDLVALQITHRVAGRPVPRGDIVRTTTPSPQEAT